MKTDPIKLDLTAHCIETETKKNYNRLLSKYFKEEDNREEIEKKIEILQSSLENFDFQKLRSTYPELAGGSNSHVLLSCDEKERPVIRINGKKIPDLFLQK